MGRYYFRPLYSVDYGDVQTFGGGAVLGDANLATGKRYFENSGSINVYPDYAGAGIPPGKEIIAVRCSHSQNNTGLFGFFNGWVLSYLRVNNKRQAVTRTYVQDGNSTLDRIIQGPPLYKNAAFTPWTFAEVNTMATECMSATADISTNNRWCTVTESYIEVVYDDAVPIPTQPFPANNEVIATSSVDFTAQVPAPQEEQPIRAVFQVARNNTFTDDVRTFVGGLNSLTTPTSRSLYNSVIQTDTYTDLGPGVWYLRMKGRDMRGSAHESAWGATTSFSIIHGALPVPTMTAPAAASISPTPYGIRSAYFTTQPSGERKVGASWQFSKDPDFASGNVYWTNTKSGFFTASPSEPKVVSYDAQPNPETLPGLNGPTVSLEDPPQYLSQGVWYGRVRAIDVYGQYGAWSSGGPVGPPPPDGSPISIIDKFNRPDGDPGAAYTPLANGGLVIASQRAQGGTTGPTSAITSYLMKSNTPFGTATQEVSKYFGRPYWTGYDKTQANMTLGSEVWLRGTPDGQTRVGIREMQTGTNGSVHTIQIVSYTNGVATVRASTTAYMFDQSQWYDSMGNTSWVGLPAPNKIGLRAEGNVYTIIVAEIPTNVTWVDSGNIISQDNRTWGLEARTSEDASGKPSYGQAILQVEARDYLGVDWIDTKVYQRPTFGSISTYFVYYAGETLRFHNGTDIAGPSGRNIYAIADGTVDFIDSGHSPSDGSAWGNAIAIYHDNEFLSAYGHLSQINVTVGQHVTKGQIIGLMGNTGNAGASHLHFSIIRGITITDLNDSWIMDKPVPPGQLPYQDPHRFLGSRGVPVTPSDWSTDPGGHP